MKLEFFFIIIIGVIIYDFYHGGKIIQKISSFKKYYKTITYIAMLVFIYILIKSKDPGSRDILYYGYNIIKQLPLNKTNTELFTSVFDMTNTESPFVNKMNEYTTFPMNGGNNGLPFKQATKRNVSEAKKRYIASSQNWKCANCNQQLNHTFEVDHKIRLEYGGSNEIDNLSALCRNCHGLKTASENINKYR